MLYFTISVSLCQRVAYYLQVEALALSESPMIVSKSRRTSSVTESDWKEGKSPTVQGTEVSIDFFFGPFDCR